MIHKYTFSLLAFLYIISLSAQNTTFEGTILNQDGDPLAYAFVDIVDTDFETMSDENGKFTIEHIPTGSYQISISYLGYQSLEQEVNLTESQNEYEFVLTSVSNTMDELVITGTLKAVNRLESPVPVEVYSPVFFKKNPTPNMYEALQNVNGVRPQLNCNVCNTGDIHINGLEGPYTMVLIDGMPIVSSLASVYGLSGIPNSLIQRMEIVKGPASSLYGSEAIGGLINIITKNPQEAPTLSIDLMTTTWKELNADLGIKFNLGPKASILTGVNYFNFDEVIDHNDDNFTDITLQERVSLFQKWQFNRKDNRIFTLAGRYYWEDRWGGETDWDKSYRGSDEIYGEAITTKRWELLGQYQLPIKERVLFSFSVNTHDQNSVYGDLPYIAEQKIGFGQFTWDKEVKNHDLLLGTALRYTYYDDNTTATGGVSSDPNNNPDETWIPGIFVQDEISLLPKHKVLVGLRYDYNDDHGNIFTPRIAYKWSITDTDILRFNAGTGFRVVNLFTEEHAALTGARDVVITEELKPERSYNANLNYIKRIYKDNGISGNIEVSTWYTYFTNIILPDYETNANQIIYDNLDGYATSKGISLNSDLSFSNGLSFLVGASLLDVSSVEDDVKSEQILTEKFTGTWTVSYTFLKNNLSIDYTGNVYGPMKLPLLSELDPRPEYSPWWSIQNIQFTYRGLKNIEFYGGIKNLLNWTPWKNQKEPIIARSFDPFDKNVVFDEDGNAVATPDNPYALTFDPSYVYAPNQGIRGFFGVRYSFK